VKIARIYSIFIVFYKKFAFEHELILRRLGSIVLRSLAHWIQHVLDKSLTWLQLLNVRAQRRVTWQV
jgi:hypothetical protein